MRIIKYSYIEKKVAPVENEYTAHRAVHAVAHKMLDNLVFMWREREINFKMKTCC